MENENNRLGQRGIARKTLLFTLAAIIIIGSIGAGIYFSSSISDQKLTPQRQLSENFFDLYVNGDLEKAYELFSKDYKSKIGPKNTWVNAVKEVNQNETITYEFSKVGIINQSDQAYKNTSPVKLEYEITFSGDKWDTYLIVIKEKSKYVIDEFQSTKR